MKGASVSRWAGGDQVAAVRLAQTVDLLSPVSSTAPPLHVLTIRPLLLVGDTVAVAAGPKTRRLSDAARLARTFVGRPPTLCWTACS